MLVYFSGDLDVHWGTIWFLTHGHLEKHTRTADGCRPKVPPCGEASQPRKLAQRASGVCVCVLFCKYRSPLSGLVWLKIDGFHGFGWVLPIYQFPSIVSQKPNALKFLLGSGLVESAQDRPSDPLWLLDVYSLSSCNHQSLFWCIYCNSSPFVQQAWTWTFGAFLRGSKLCTSMIAANLATLNSPTLFALVAHETQIEVHISQLPPSPSPRISLGISGLGTCVHVMLGVK